MERKKDPDIDGGYAWVILAGCFFMYLFVVGSIKAYGVLYTEILEYYQAGAGLTAWIGSACLLLMLGLGPIANLLSKRFSFRVVAIAGGFLIGLGYVISAFVPSVIHLLFTFGLTVGLGYGLSFSPCSTIISFYFVKYRALANGITVSASGIGALSLPFLYKYLINEYTLPGTFLIIGGILLNVCAAACVFRQPKFLVDLKKKAIAEQHRKSDRNGLLNGEKSHMLTSEEEENKTKSTNCCNSNVDFLKLSLFKNPRFTLLIISFVICMNGYGNNLILIPSQVAKLGYDKVKIATSVAIMGGSEVVARIVFGWIADKEYIKRRHIFIFNMAFSSIFAFLAPMDVFQNFTYMAVYAAIIGVFPGSFWSLMAVLVIDVVGLEDFTAAFGLLSFSLAIGASISQPSIGWLYDYHGNWNAAFIVTGVLLLLSAIVFAAEPYLSRLCLNSPEPNEAQIEQITIDQMPVRIRNKSSPIKETAADDTGSLLDEDEINVSFTSARISRIYRPIKPDPPPSSPDRTSAPVVDPSEM